MVELSRIPVIIEQILPGLSERQLLHYFSTVALEDERVQADLERRASQKMGTYDILYIRYVEIEDRYRVRFQTEVDGQMVEAVAIVVPGRIQTADGVAKITVNKDHSYDVVLSNALKDQVKKSGERIKL